MKGAELRVTLKIVFGGMLGVETAVMDASYVRRRSASGIPVWDADGELSHVESATNVNV